MRINLITFLPIAGGVYGALVGGYIRSRNKTPKRKIALLIAGVLLLSVCVGVFIMAIAARLSGS